MSKIIETYITPEYLKRLKKLKDPKRYLYVLLQYFKKYDEVNENNILEFLYNYPIKSRNVAFYALKHYCKYNDIPFKLTLRDIETFPNEMRDKPTLTEQECENLIKLVFNKNIDFLIRFNVLVAMLYGTRSIELSKITPEDIDIDKQEILIKTAKKGVVRKHYIPKETLPFFKLFKLLNTENLSIPQLRYTWTLVEKYANIPHRNHLGWHSIRRTLATKLLNVLNPAIVVSYLRWSHKDILMTYYKPDVKVRDQKVFEVHPFLKLYKKELNNFVKNKGKLI